MAMATEKKEDAPKAEPQTGPTFLKDVAQMATLAEEASRRLRTEVHGDGFKFKDLDLSYLFPQTVNSVEYLERLEPVVRDYLSQTARFGLDEKGHPLSSNSIEENTASYEYTIKEWMRKVYTPRKEDIDARVEALSKDISDYANLKARDAALALGTHSNDKNRFMTVAGKPELGLDNLLAGTLAELKTQFYETELPHPEDLVKLYELCFNAEVKQRGWMELEDEKLAEALEAEKVPLKMFGKYTGREVRMPEKQPEKKGKLGVIGRILETLAPAQRQGASAGTLQVVGVPKQYHICSASDYFTALQQLRLDCASDPNSLQPSVTIAGQDYVRLLTVKEIMQFRLEDYNTLTNPGGSIRTEEDREQLLTQWFFSGSGIAYSAGDGKFKLSRAASPLITMDSVPAQAGLPVDYSALNGQDWHEFDRNQRGIKYNIFLTKKEVVNHPGWRFLAEDDARLLRETYQLNRNWYDVTDVRMGFWLLNTPTQNQLRVLTLSNFNYPSNLSNDYGSSFLRVARRSS